MKKLATFSNFYSIVAVYLSALTALTISSSEASLALMPRSNWAEFHKSEIICSSVIIAACATGFVQGVAAFNRISSAGLFLLWSLAGLSIAVLFPASMHSIAGTLSDAQTKLQMSLEVFFVRETVPVLALMTIAVPSVAMISFERGSDYASQSNFNSFFELFVFILALVVIIAFNENIVNFINISLIS